MVHKIWVRFNISEELPQKWQLGSGLQTQGSANAFFVIAITGSLVHWEWFL